MIIFRLCCYQTVITTQSRRWKQELFHIIYNGTDEIVSRIASVDLTERALRVVIPILFHNNFLAIPTHHEHDDREIGKSGERRNEVNVHVHVHLLC